jgi:SAM-dependent methyltransferase
MSSGGVVIGGAHFAAPDDGAPGLALPSAVRRSHQECPGCERTDVPQVVYGETVPAVLQCRTCGMVWSDRTVQVAKSALNEAIYGSEHYAIREEFAERAARLEARERLAEIRAHRGAPSSTSRLLDVGCGMGWFLAEARREGWRTYGLEVNRRSARRSARFGGAICCGGIEALSAGRGVFDVVTLWHVLEHFDCPVETLRLVRTVLRRDGGLLALEVPNFGSDAARRAGSRWQWLWPWEHRVHFTAHSLEGVLRRSGFRVVGVSSHESLHVSVSQALYALLGRLRRRPKGSDDAAQATIASRGSVLFNSPHHYRVIKAAYEGAVRGLGMALGPAHDFYRGRLNARLGGAALRVIAVPE